MAEFPKTPSGAVVPVLKVAQGLSQESNVTHLAATLALSVRAASDPLVMVRVWAFGCAIYFKMGNSGVTAPTSIDACIPKDSYVETYLAGAETHIRAIGRTDQGGTTAAGTFRLEVLT